MSLSINSVIHFTDRIENLKSILSCNGFRIKYCAEELGINNRNTTVGAFPMVCFCDIPLSEIKNHIDSYGSYGIGLTKNWAKQTGLNPVLYIERNSRLANFLNMQSNRLLELHQEGKPDTASMFEYFKFLSYCKNYEGRLVRGDKNEENYRFYNEREWRIVALSEEINNQLTFMYGDLYFKNKQKINEKIQDCYVKFSHLDISYLIVDNEAEIPELLNAINHIYEDYATAKELKILSSKILTKTQICNDF